MSFVQSDGSYFVRGGKRFFPVGINYLPSYLCGNYFADYRRDHIRADLDHMKRIGLDSVRVPVFWAGFEPEEGAYSESYLTAFREFVGECRQRDLLVMPVFLIGTWTGMYDAPYWKPPGMYQGEMLDLEERHVAAFAQHFADDPAILCWDLSDEPFYLEEIPPAPARTALGQPPSRREIGTNWVARLAAAVRRVDPNHLITLGFDPHPVRADTGFALEEVAEHLDVMSYCIYPWPPWGAEVGLIAYGAFQTRFFASGKPAFSHEGPGISSSAASEEVLAGRFRAWMYSSLANGNIGVLPWNYTDYEEEQHHRWPLNESPQEPDFGVCTVNRSLKPRGEELLRFAEDVRRIPLDEVELPAAPAAMIYPDAYYERAEGLHGRFWRHFTMAKGANIGLALCREDRLPSDASLLIVPGFSLRLSTWGRLRDFAAAGGTLLAIMDDYMMLNPTFPDLFGVSVEAYRPGAQEATFLRPWGGLPESESVAFPGAADRLWVEPAGADVIAAFDDGYPFLLANSVGRGRAILATLPFPRLLDIADPQVAACRAAIAIYRGARDLAGCRPPVDTDLPWVETALFRSTTGGDDWAVLVHYDRGIAGGLARVEGNYGAIFTAGGDPVPAERRGDEVLVPIHLGPHDARLWRLARQ